MIKVTFIATIIAVLSIAFSPSHAEIYRWVDDQGKAHFSDHPPEEQVKSEEVSGQLSPLNRDSSAGETQKLQQVFKSATPEEKALEQQQEAEKKRSDQKIDKICQQARKQLKVLKGRVFFTDDNGKEIVVTEEERQQRAARLEQQIRDQCS